MLVFHMLEWHLIFPRKATDASGLRQGVLKMRWWGSLTQQISHMGRANLPYTTEPVVDTSQYNSLPPPPKFILLTQNLVLAP